MSSLTRRRFLVTSAVSVGSAIVTLGSLKGQSAPENDSSYKQSQQESHPACDESEPPVPVKMHVSAVEPIHVMRGGIGASFHTISTALPGSEPNGSSWSGSAWGGNPAAGDDKRWDELFRHAEWLGMNWCRVELEQHMYEPERRKFEWENSEMRVLYRVLDWAERRGVNVFLQQMWGNVAWNAYPGNAEDPDQAPAQRPVFNSGVGFRDR